MNKRNLAFRLFVLTIAFVMLFEISATPVYAVATEIGEILNQDVIITMTGYELQDDVTIESSVFLTGDTLDLNGHTLLITGDLIQSAGIVKVNGGKLIVNGNYLIDRLISITDGKRIYANESTGVLDMTKYDTDTESDTESDAESDTESDIVVFGNFVTYSSEDHSKYLTNGILEIKGNFEQKGASKSFCASGNHTVLLSGSGQQNVKFKSIFSCFAKLELHNVSEKGVVFQYSNNVGIKTSVKNPSTKTTGYINMLKGSRFEGEVYNGDVIFANSYAFQNDITINGEMILNANNTVDINAHSVTVNCVKMWNGELNINGTWNNGTWNNGTLTCKNDINPISDIAYHYGGTISIYHGTLNCEGNLNIINDVSLNTASFSGESANEINVNGNFKISNSTNSSFISSTNCKYGPVNLKGDFIQESSNTCNINYILFCGDKQQTVILNTKNPAYFGTLETTNTSEGGVYCPNGLNAGTIKNNYNKITFPCGGIYGWKLENNEKIDGDLYLVGGELNLNGHELEVTGDLIQAVGTINLNDGKLQVNGDYLLNTIEEIGDDGTKTYTNSSTGILKMENSGEIVAVNKHFESYSNKYFNFTNGELIIGGDYRANINCTGDHTIRFTSNAKHSIESSSYLNNLIIDEGSELVPESNITVKGSIEDNSSNIGKDHWFNIDYISQLESPKFNGNLFVCTDSENKAETLNDDLIIAGDFKIHRGLKINGHTLKANKIVVDYNSIDVNNGVIDCSNDISFVGNGILNVNGGTVYCDGNLSFETISKLIMTNPNDSVFVKGDFSISSSIDHEGLLTNGKLVICGNFEQKAGDASNFYATGKHEVILGNNNNANMQKIHFDSIGSSTFNILTLKKPIYKFAFNTDDISNICTSLVKDYIDDNFNFITVTDTQATSVSLSWDSEVSGFEYEIYRNNEEIFTTDKSYFTDNGLDPETEYSYRICGKDYSNNLSIPSQEIKATTTKDLEAPSVPKNVNISRKTGSAIYVSWDASSDNHRVQGYEVCIDGKRIVETTDTSYKDANISDSDIHTYTVRAYDASGNKSEFSDEATGKVSQPKIVSVTPNDLSIIGGDSAKISTVFENSGNSVGNSVYIEYSKIGENNWIAVTESAVAQQNYSIGKLYVEYNWDISNLTSGDYNIRITLYDEDGNTDVEEVVYTLKTEAPNPVTGLTASGENGTVWLNWEKSTSADCKNYVIYKSNSGENYTKLAETSNDNVIAYSDKDVTVGETYYYKVTAISKYNGKESLDSNIAAVTVSEDNIAPEVKYILPDGNRINKTTRFTVKASDNVKVATIKFEYNDGEEWATIGEKDAVDGKAVFDFDTTQLADGDYYFRAVATDIYGNVNDVEFKHNYEIDNTGISKINVSNISSSTSFVSIEWDNITETDFGYFSVEQKVNGEFVEFAKEKNTLGRHVTDLQPDTEYTFRVVGYDNLGNRGVESDEVTIKTKNDDMSPVITAIYPAPSNFASVIPLDIQASDNISVNSMSLYYSLDNTNWTELTTSTVSGINKKQSFKYNFDVSLFEDGIVYVKAIVVDSSNNESQEVTTEFNVDHTAPEAITSLLAEGKSGYIELSWIATSDDTKYFEIYRAKAEDGIYERIEKQCTTKNYYDVTAKLGTVYCYKIKAVDIAGNISEESNVAIGQVLKDTDAPVVGAVTPASGSVISKGTVIKAVTTDNNKVKDITFEYKAVDSQEDIWTTISTVSVNSNYKAVSVNWDNGELDEGEYEVRIYATDMSGNTSQAYNLTYTLDKTAPEDPILTMTQENWQISLKWEQSECEDFSHYKLYRKIENGNNENPFTLIKELKNTSYVDTKVEPYIQYSYKVVAYDKAGNYAESRVISGVCYDVDDVAPTAVVPEVVTAIAGYEFALDASESFDNVRIVRYEWDMGDGNIIYGVRPDYTYDKAGNYRVKLTVKDAKENSNSTYINVNVSEPTTNGNAWIEVVDVEGNAIKYAQVYLKVSDDEEQVLKTDSHGRLNICTTLGEHKIAVYKQGYLPVDATLKIDSIDSSKVERYVLQSGEIVTGDLTYHPMTLSEMVEAGIDLNAPGNYHYYKFSVELTFAQEPIPITLQIVGGDGGFCNICGSYSGDFGGLPSISGGGGNLQFTIVEPEEENDEVVPILAYIKTENQISWLKDMYTVNLGVLNNANSYFSIEDCYATLNLPHGLSLADTTKDNNSYTQSMGTIYGQENKYVSWYVRGDLPGEYNISASFEGILMPFKTKVSAFFECENPLEVEVGNGLVIYVMPESAAYINANYYIQFCVKNESNRPYYNVSTDFGTFTVPYNINAVIAYDGETGEVIDRETTVVGETYTIPEANKCPVLPVMCGGETLEIGVLNPGDAIYGTFVTLFEAEGDKEKVYYKLIDSLVKEIENNSHSAVQVRVQPIPSHISRQNIKVVQIPSFFADPVDLSTGAFTDTLSALSIESDSILQFDINYNSLDCNTKGELGYGWHHGFETYIEDDHGRKQLHFDNGNCITFITEQAANRNVYGHIEDGKIVLDNVDMPGEQNYVCVSAGMSDYLLCKNADETYTLNMPSGEVLEFDAQGRLSKLIEYNKKEITFEHVANQTIITDTVTNKKLILNYADSGLLTSVADEYGRNSTFTYNENNCLIKFTNPLNETIQYEYDENNRIVSGIDNTGTNYLTNTYDDQNRVLAQDDADENTPLTYFNYSTEGDFEVTTATDRNGNSVKYYFDSNGNVVRYQNQNGESVEYEYDEKGNIVKETDPYQNSTTYTYYENGYLKSCTDALGNTTTYEYDDRGNITKVDGECNKSSSYTYNVANLLMTDTQNGREKTYTYNAYGQVLSETIKGLGTKTYTYENGLMTGVIDFEGNVSQYEYDDFGNIHKITDNEGNTTTYNYDDLNRIVSKVDANSGIESYTYDFRGNLTSVTAANGEVTTYEYDNNGNAVKITYPKGESVSYEYDNEGRCTKIINPDETFSSTEYDAAGNAIKTIDELKNETTYTYDKLNRVVTKTLPNGLTVTNEYYPNGELKKETYSDGKSLTYVYDKALRLVKTIDNSNNATEYEYDSNDNLISVTDAEGNVVSYTYDVYGNKTSVTDANGNTTNYEYNKNGLCVKVTNPVGLVCEYEYNSANQITKASAVVDDETVSSVFYEYDALGRVSKYIDELGNEFLTKYDAVGNVTEITDAKGNVIKKSGYDAESNLISDENALGVKNSYSYDISGNLISLIENVNAQNQRTTSYEYDELDRLVKVTDAENGVSEYKYDSVGNITEVTDPNGGVTKYTYDLMGRITKSISALGSVNNYTYNADGLLAEKTNARKQSTSYTYDKIGRLTSLTDELGTVSYTYDNNGNVLTVTDENGTIEREYDALNRVTKYTDFRGNTVNYSYDTLGNLVQLEYPGGKIVRYEYYKNGALKKVIDWDNRETQYEYDSNGRSTKVSRPDGSVEEYSYNAAGYLVSQVDRVGEEAVNEFTYTYDDFGNIVKIESLSSGAPTNLTSCSMQYDADNKLISYNGEEVKYDADGNMIYGPLNGQMVAYEYDCRNRLVKAGDTTYQYDAENQRIGVVTCDTKTEYFVESVASSLSQILFSTKYIKTANGWSNGETTYYVYGAGLIGQENAAKGYLTYHYNNVGSTTAVTDINGSVVYRYEYNAYGELIFGETGQVEFMYNGRYGVVTDKNGLYFMRARYYNVDIKRFINQDVLTGSITDSPSLNRYAYVQGNPVSLMDPFGLSPSAASMFGHAALDLLGMIPVYGIAFDAINAVWYCFEGDYFGAFCSIASAIPVAGEFVGGVMVGTKFAKYASIVKKTSNIIGGVGKIAQAGHNMGNSLGDLYVRFSAEGANFWNELFSVNTLLDICSLGMDAACVFGTGSKALNAASKYSSSAAKNYSAGQFDTSNSNTNAIAGANSKSAGKSTAVLGEDFATLIDYSDKFDKELVNFNDGYKICTFTDEELILVQFSSDSPNASLSYWTTIDEANKISTLNEYMDKMAISKEWGNRNVVKVARIPAGTNIKYAVGTARAQTLIPDPRPGKGIQYLFSQFDTKWITEVRSFPN